MDRNNKIRSIVEFVSSYPESTASRTVTRRVLNRDYFEFSQDLAFHLQERLSKIKEEDLDFYYYLVK